MIKVKKGPVFQGDVGVRAWTDGIPESYREVTARGGDGLTVKVIHSPLGHHHVVIGSAKVYASPSGVEHIVVPVDAVELRHEQTGPHAHESYELPAGTSWYIWPQIQGAQGAQVAD
jgi:hypothetical protein